jgi:hypothetical protein
MECGRNPERKKVPNLDLLAIYMRNDRIAAGGPRMELEPLENRLLMATHAAHVLHAAHHDHVLHGIHTSHHAHTLHHSSAAARELRSANHLNHVNHEAHILRTTVPAPLIMTAEERSTWPTIRDEFLANLKRLPK